MRIFAYALAFLLPIMLMLSPMKAHALNVVEVTSPSGVTAWLVEDHSVPVISMEFAFRSGASLDPAGKPGVAYFTAGMLDEGAGDLKSEEFQKLLEDKAISLSFDADRDNFKGSLKTLTTNADEAYRLLHLALTKPRFDKDAFARVRQQLQAELKQMMADPSWAAFRTANMVLLKGHPYANPVRGTIKSLNKISTGDLKTFVRDRMARDKLHIAVAGDITKEQLSQILEKIFGNLPKKAKEFSVPDIQFVQNGQTFVVKRELPQSRLVILQKSFKRLDPDWPALNIMNYVLGAGGFNSRLMLEVREKRGLTYGVSSSISNFEHFNMIAVNAATSNDKAKEALDLIRKEWRTMADGGISDDELKDAKTFLTGALPLALTSTDKIAGFLLQTQLERLPINYDQQRIDEINRVTRDDIARVAKRVLNEKDLNVVVVGKPTQFEDAHIVQDPAHLDD